VTAGVAPARGSATGAVTEVATVEVVVLLRGVALEVGLVGFNVKCEWQFSQPTHTHNFARPWPSPPSSSAACPRMWPLTSPHATRLLHSVAGTMASADERGDLCGKLSTSTRHSLGGCAVHAELLARPHHLWQGLALTRTNRPALRARGQSLQAFGKP
jgi:hypothetical protein